MLLVDRYVNICRKIFIELTQQFLEHVIPLIPLYPFKDLGNMDQVTDKFRSREENLMLTHIVRKSPNDLLIMPRHQGVCVKLRVKLGIVIADY